MTSRFARTTLPPKTGHFSYTAYNIPGRVTSMPKSGAPVTMARLSTPEVDRPMMPKSAGCLSATALISGTGSVAARVATSP